MPHVTLRPLAEEDILDIWATIAADSTIAADRWIDRLDERMNLWATQPRMGRSREELAHGLHSLVMGRYVVFYQPRPDGIDVVRVLHGARDLNEHFPPGD